jgi:hypothetical protein
MLQNLAEFSNYKKKQELAHEELTLEKIYDTNAVLVFDRGIRF